MLSLYFFRLKADNNYNHLKPNNEFVSNRKNSDIINRKTSDISSTRKLSDKNALNAKVELKQTNKTLKELLG